MSAKTLFEQCPNDYKEWCKELNHPCTEECLKKWQAEQAKMINDWANWLMYGRFQCNHARYSSQEAANPKA